MVQIVHRQHSAHHHQQLRRQPQQAGVARATRGHDGGAGARGHHVLDGEREGAQVVRGAAADEGGRHEHQAERRVGRDHVDDERVAADDAHEARRGDVLAPQREVEHVAGAGGRVLGPPARRHAGDAAQVGHVQASLGVRATRPEAVVDAQRDEARLQHEDVHEPQQRVHVLLGVIGVIVVSGVVTGVRADPPQQTHHVRGRAHPLGHVAEQQHLAGVARLPRLWLGHCKTSRRSECLASLAGTDGHPQAPRQVARLVAVNAETEKEASDLKDWP